MKTIEISELSYKKNRLLIKQIYKRFLTKDQTFHFFYEPQLIIRVESEKTIKSIRAFLSYKGYKHQIYDYPFPKNKRFGEEKKSVTFKYKNYFIPVLHYNSVISLTSKKKDKNEIYSRLAHLYLNSHGFEWIDEAIINLTLSIRLQKVMLRYEFKTGITRYWLNICIFISHLLVKMLRLLKK